MAHFALPFEKPILDLEQKLDELRHFSEDQDLDVSQEINRIRRKIEETRQSVYARLTPWQKVQVARHPLRPYPRDYIQRLAPDFVELHGDRIHADDRAIIGGFGTIADQRVMFLATQKGRDTRSNLECNFGCAYPEGYRKALRLMKLAAKFHTPVISLIDTPGAYPGLQSEERHIAEAIAVNLREAAVLPVPLIATVTGEGGSGGALGIGVADRLLILEHAYYSVISPEGCAAILWKDRKYADRAAEALKLTAQDLFEHKLVDEVIAEPVGGAHTNYDRIASDLKAALLKYLEELRGQPVADLLEARYAKLRAYGVYDEPT